MSTETKIVSQLVHKILFAPDFHVWQFLTPHVSRGSCCWIICTFIGLPISSKGQKQPDAKVYPATACMQRQGWRGTESGAEACPGRTGMIPKSFQAVSSSDKSIFYLICSHFCHYDHQFLYRHSTFILNLKNSWCQCIK